MIESGISLYSGPIVITVGYFALWYYLLLFYQRGTKYRLNAEYKKQEKVFDRYFGQDEQMLAADRVIINTQEQMVPFLFSLWLHAIYVSSTVATVLGAFYIILRGLYPLLMGKSISKIQPKRVYYVTLPSYLIIFYFLGASLWAAVV